MRVLSWPRCLSPYRALANAAARRKLPNELPLRPHATNRRGIMSTQPASPQPQGSRRQTRPDLTIEHVRAAAARIAGAVVDTPMMHSITLSEITGADIWLKFENLQFTAAYKERGALNALLLLNDEQRARGVIAASAGNHSQGLSYHGTRLGVPVTIVMPRTTPTVKVMQTEKRGRQGGARRRDLR